MIDGTSSSIVEFDRLKQEEEYAAVLELSEEDMVSSHMVKRFFCSSSYSRENAYRHALRIDGRIKTGAWVELRTHFKISISVILN